MPLPFQRKKSISELEEEREYREVELSVAQQIALKKEVEARGASLDGFKDGGRTSWARVKNWLKTH